MCNLYICRICLNTAVKGYKLEMHSLITYYEHVLRQKVNIRDGLPQWVCYECAMILHKYHKFREKCFHGQHVLKQISLRGNITYESVSIINRYSENLMSPVGIAVASKRVKSATFKWKDKPISQKRDDKLVNAPHERIDIKTEININEISKVGAKCITFESTQNTYNDESNINKKNVGSDKNVQKVIKHEDVEEIITQSSTDPIKNEISESSIQVPENVRNDSENAIYDSDSNFDITVNTNDISSDDESLMEKVKDRSNAKRKLTNTTKPETKVKKTKTESEVKLKNTLPKKHVLNPQFWKKISLNEEEAVREFKRREFDNDYYSKAKYKCQTCLRGFSKNEMLVRHMKHWHDKTKGKAECRFCHKRFRHKYELTRHMQEHLILHHCLQCGLKFSRIDSALVHQEQHNGFKRICEHCGKEFNHLTTYYTHLRVSHRSSHVCVACGSSFVSELGLLQHTKLKHFDNLKQLEEIRKRRESNKAGASNERPAVPVTESSAAPEQIPDTEEIYCAKCDIKFMSRQAFDIHFLKSDNHDDGDAYAALHKDVTPRGQKLKIRPRIPTTCEHCDQEFPSRQAYKKHHQAEHSHIPLYIPDERDICEICGASIQASSIQYHMKSHTGEREFACPAPACGMRFTLKANMQRHYNVKHLGIIYPKYIRKTPGKRKKKTQEILDDDFSPFVRMRP